MNANAYAPLLAAVLLSLVVAAGPDPARAQLNCGDGIVNLGEDCDDGNLVAGDCCSPGCRFESAATICRTSVDPCDAAEHCTGDSATCPPDTGILGDSDGDGVCDPLDVCPDVSDPLQLDRDGDGVGDACDPCTNIVGVIHSFRLRLRKLDLPFGQQRLRYRAFVTVPSTPPIDPSVKGIRLVITDARKRTILDVTIPPLAFDPGTRVGWAQLGSGDKWIFLDGSDLIEGVDKATVRVRPTQAAGATDLRIVMESGGHTSAITPELPVTLALVIDTPVATNGQCVEVTPSDKDCTFRNQGGKLLCRGH